ncbi:NAD(P)-binding domain-containing protein [Pseudohalocynthiibacter sp. F2068]|jgi:pyrroline-5-carboxylate reductase|uniref:NAD(P)-binding domain-containing protein n=1 Tax=Pseudohalocynthiibacter sp. F2068 TaxID=2926418 RepID=UPI001FF1D056|nr:NAD(P)-binding domain-containing protein [Pseudohalocynthiibacter sp. F2068]MCK0101450.1 NAD(P)-binding domain-containing protein [Pseudohalocynthiibacter sp. F2068]
MRIGVVGTGTIASAMVDGIAADGHEITVSERGRKHAARLASAYSNVTVADNQTVIDNSDVVILGLMADVAPGIMNSLKFRPDQIVVSAMAGVKHDQLVKMVKPAKEATTAIPFPAIAKGGSPLLVFPRLSTVETLFGERNHIVNLSDEAKLDAYMAAQAVLSPIVKLLEETTNWLADRTGSRADAEQFLRALIGGSLMSQSSEDSNVFTAMLEELNTPGGFNAELRELFVEKGVMKTLHAGLAQLEDRLKAQED